MYWLVMSFIKGKPRLVPFVLIMGIAEVVGMAQGFRDLITGRIN
jgi:hypothetical protein